MKRYQFHRLEGVESVCGIKQGSPLKINYVKVKEVSSQDTSHYHPLGQEYYIYLKGKAILEVEGKHIDASTGDIILVEAGERHRVLQIIEPVECLVIRTNHSLGDRIAVE